MESSNYQSDFYNTERERQEERRRPSIPLQQQQQQQQQQQHAAHYPLELPIPYLTNSQHQSEFVVDQPHGTFHAPTAHILSTLYHDSGPVLPNSNILHHAHQHPPVTFGGHGVKSSLHHAPPITTHESAVARNVLPITDTSQETDSERNMSSIQSITTHETGVQSSASIPKGQTPVGQATSNQIQSEKHGEQVSPSQQCNASPLAPTTSTEKPQLLAALNLKTNNSVGDLPSSLSVRLTSQNKVDGVFAKETIDKGAEFGPYKGALMNEDLGWCKETTWEVCMADNVFYIDGRKTWMSHLSCAKTEEEQNMEAFQYYDGNIYFRSIKVIDPGSELKVFYSEEYGKHVGIKTRLKDLKFNLDSQKFQCSLCEDLFISAKLILRHIRCQHFCGNLGDMIPVLTWQKRDKKKYVVSSNKQTEKKVALADSNYKCSTCQKIFPSLGRLKEHELFHIMMNEPNKFECNECNQKYEVQSSLKRHKRKAHGKFQDNIPQRRGPKESKTLLDDSNNKVDHGSNAYKCSECNQSYSSLPLLKTHENQSHGYLCQFCTKRFSRKSDRSKHQRKHQANKLPHSSDEPKDMLGRPTDYYTRPFKCHFCPKRYCSRSTVDQHEKEVHTGEGTFKCAHCPKVYAIESRLKEHIVVHKHLRLHQCTLCPKSFASESALNNHQGEHTGLKPFKCEICGRGFRIRNHYNAHKQRMHRDRPLRFFCSVCNKGFTEKGNLTKHEQRHKGIRQFVCLECGKGFTAKHTLAAHTQAVHSKEKAFCCQICSKTFSLNHLLNHHMAKYHTDMQRLEDNGCT